MNLKESFNNYLKEDDGLTIESGTEVLKAYHISTSLQTLLILSEIKSSIASEVKEHLKDIENGKNLDISILNKVDKVNRKYITSKRIPLVINKNYVNEKYEISKEDFVFLYNALKEKKDVDTIIKNLFGYNILVKIIEEDKIKLESEDKRKLNVLKVTIEQIAKNINLDFKIVDKDKNPLTTETGNDYLPIIEMEELTNEGVLDFFKKYRIVASERVLRFISEVTENDADSGAEWNNHLVLFWSGSERRLHLPSLNVAMKVMNNFLNGSTKKVTLDKSYNGGEYGIQKGYLNRFYNVAKAKKVPMSQGFTGAMALYYVNTLINKHDKFSIREDELSILEKYKEILLKVAELAGREFTLVDIKTDVTLEQAEDNYFTQAQETTYSLKEAIDKIKDRGENRKISISEQLYKMMEDRLCNIKM